MPLNEPLSLSAVLSEFMHNARVGDARLARLVSSRFPALGLHRSNIRNWRLGFSQTVREWRQLVAIAVVLNLRLDQANKLLTTAELPSIHQLWLVADESDKDYLMLWMRAEPPPSAANLNTHPPVDWEISSNNVFIRYGPRVDTVNASFIPPHSAGWGGILVGQATLFEKAMTVLLSTRTTPVILHGMPGVGKSALASSLAWACLSHFPGGVIWIDHSLDSISDLLNEIGRLYQDRDTELLALQKKSSRVRYHLNQYRTLVVLDNCTEREVASSFYERCAPAGLIITTRSKLALPGDLYHVPPLSDTASENLFRTVSHIPEEVSDAAIRQLVKTLGGHPQAIIVLASICVEEQLSPSEVLRMFKDPKRDAHQLKSTNSRLLGSVWDSFAISYERLPPNSQKLLKCLGGLWSRTVCEELVEFFLISRGVQNPPLAIKELVKRSLIATVDPIQDRTRCYSIHDLLYAFARDLLEIDGDSLGQTREYWCQSLSDFALSHASPAFDDCFALEHEIDNLVGAVRWAAQHGLREYSYRIVQALAQSNLVELRGFFAQGLLIFDIGVAVAKEMEDEQAVITFTVHLATSQFMSGRFEEALETAQKGLAGAQAQGDFKLQQTCYDILGTAYRLLGLNVQAQACHAKAAEIAQQREDVEAYAVFLGNKGLDYYHLGEIAQAIQCFEEALKISVSGRDRLNEGRHLSRMADAYLAWGNPKIAIAFFQQSLPIAIELGNRVGEMYDRGGLARAYYDLGQLTQAKVEIAAAQGIAASMGHPEEVVWLALAARIANQLGKTDEGLEYARNALGLAQQIRYVRGEAFSHLALAECAGHSGNDEEALRAAGAAFRLTARYQHKELRAHALLLLGEIVERSGGPRNALRRLWKREVALRSEWKQTDRIHWLKYKLDKLPE